MSRTANNMSNNGTNSNNQLMNNVIKHLTWLNQLPGRVPNQLPGQVPNQLPGQVPNQLPGQVPNTLPNNSSQWLNYYSGSQATTNGPSTAPAPSSAPKSMTALTSWNTLYNYPNPMSAPSVLNNQQVSLSSTVTTGTAVGNGTYNMNFPHPIHSQGNVAASSSNGISGNPQSTNTPNSLFPMPPHRTSPSSTFPPFPYIPTIKAPKHKAKQPQTNPKKPRGRPRKVRVATVGAGGANYQINVPYPYPAVTATSSTAAVFLPTTITEASVYGMPSNSTSTTQPPKYVPPLNSRPVLTAAVPIPPNWHANMEHSVMSLLTFNKYEIDRDTGEYRSISEMLYPISVEGVEQIVNPDLWDRFVKTRTEMMRSKTDDLNVLTKLGLNEKEVMRCAHLSLNFVKDPLIIPYSDNMVLLFHCTRSQPNIKSILSQGLDERLSNISGGLLGKGIYFADDPNKSIQYDGTGYIFIFAVLLGDCISVDHFPNKNALVREPEKVTEQKRNFNDHFFDSIVARPAGHNEYVIYNRYQCCPIYQIKYDLQSTAVGRSSDSIFNSSSRKLPPIAWIPSGSNYAMPIQDQKINWPFFAVDIFTSMGMPPPTDEGDSNSEVPENTSHNTSNASIDENLATLTNLGFTDDEQNRGILNRFNNDIDRAVNFFLDSEGTAEDVVVNDVEQSIVEENSIHSTSASSETLISLGFSDETKNREILAKFNNDIARTVNYFLDNAVIDLDDAGVADTNGGQSSRIAADKSIVTIDLVDDDSYCEGGGTSAKTATKPDTSMDLPDEIAEWALELRAQNDQTELEDCPICYDEISASKWQVLECKHKLCIVCYSKLLTSRLTMSGIMETFVKCPFCHAIFGNEIGTCPDMQMNISTEQITCEGYSTFSTLVIDYVGQNFKRTAYLPNTFDGRDVLRLLKIAFDRRLCFTVGTSNTTGQQNAIVWNIHHKTAIDGGVTSYGYPDPEYLDRVRSELKAFGIQ